MAMNSSANPGKSAPVTAKVPHPIEYDKDFKHKPPYINLPHGHRICYSARMNRLKKERVREASSDSKESMETRVVNKRDRESDDDIGVYEIDQGCDAQKRSRTESLMPRSTLAADMRDARGISPIGLTSEYDVPASTAEQDDPGKRQSVCVEAESGARVLEQSRTGGAESTLDAGPSPYTPLRRSPNTLAGAEQTRGKTSFEDVVALWHKSISDAQQQAQMAKDNKIVAEAELRAVKARQTMAKVLESKMPGTNFLDELQETVNRVIRQTFITQVGRGQSLTTGEEARRAAATPASSVETAKAGETADGEEEEVDAWLKGLMPPSVHAEL